MIRFVLHSREAHSTQKRSSVIHVGAFGTEHLVASILIFRSDDFTRVNQEANLTYTTKIVTHAQPLCAVW
jgi:hypothetical protein